MQVEHVRFGVVFDAVDGDVRDWTAILAIWPNK